MKENIGKLKDCYGCGVCCRSCPQNIIGFSLNSDGFYSPNIIDEDKCTECGICLDICAYNHDALPVEIKKNEINAYGCWSKNPEIRESSTSGGLAYEIASKALENESDVCAVKYDTKGNRAVNFIVKNPQELRETQGSKYIPSFTWPGYKQINLRSQNLIFGLPCQIDSWRRLIRRFKVEDNFLLVDMLCHGTPSLLLWRNFIKETEKITGKIESVNFRSKKKGWHRPGILIKGKATNLYTSELHSLFYKLFFNDICLNKCCQGKCKYKLLKSSADIRMGDFWGKKYAKNQEGASVAIAYTERGKEMINELSDRCVFEPSSLEEAMDKQMAHNAPSSPFRDFMLAWLRRGLPLKPLYIITRLAMVAVNPLETFKAIKNKLFRK